VNYIVWAVLAVVFNVLDSVTTHIALNKLPENVRAKEANFFMKGLMDKNPLMADIIKQVVVIALVIYFIFNRGENGGEQSLAYFAMAFGIVVLSNTYTIIARLIRKRKVDSPLMFIPKLLHIPNKIDYLFIVAEIMGISFLIGRYLFGIRY
jgi:uncharacterized membrane protein